jgi:HK97 family phage prohead protease
MLTHETIVTPCEFKFTEGGPPGEFTGYGSVFNTLDDHGDVVLPGAFAGSITSHKGSGTMPGMYVEHSGFKGGDPLPVGVWQDMTEDENGLLVKGRISALDTDHGKRIVGLMRDKALPGLSIAYVVPTGGAVFGKKAGEPRRQIKQMDLHSVDIVRNPSNRAARIYQMKSLLAHADHTGAVAAGAAAIKLHRGTMIGGDSMTADGVRPDQVVRLSRPAHDNPPNRWQRNRRSRAAATRHRKGFLWLLRLPVPHTAVGGCC